METKTHTQFFIFINGCPGSGKTTLMKKLLPLLIKKGHAFHSIDMGDASKAHISNDLCFGKISKSLREDGFPNLVMSSISTINTWFKEHYAKDRHFIVVGSPYTPQEGWVLREALEKLREKSTHNIVYASIILETQEDVATDRLNGRPEKRPGDSIETFRNRFKIWKERTLPSINEFQFSLKIPIDYQVDIDASLNQEDVLSDTYETVERIMRG